MRPVSLFQVWTIQTLSAWEQLKATGVLRADEQFIEPYFHPAYDWLTAQMKTRMGLPPEGVTYPIWFWYQWENASRRRPDLRQAGHLLRGERGVLLECRVSKDAVLLSDFGLWHYVLNNWYLSASQGEQDAFEWDADPTHSSASVATHWSKTKSWEWIFDLDFANIEEDYPPSRAEKCIQGVTWELCLEQVRQVQIFTAR